MGFNSGFKGLTDTTLESGESKILLQRLKMQETVPSYSVLCLSKQTCSILTIFADRCLNGILCHVWWRKSPTLAQELLC